ncbi:MAG: sigma 54-dependent Fis family transcriptional regulator [Archangiaceae bacterium]|nr:sigma 54-dependent Fis family transcriptional regulator [Archangiaceae bacterium]
MSLEGPTVPSQALKTSGPNGAPKKFEVTVLSGPDAGLTRSNLDKVVVGKSVEATLQLKDEQISRAHLEIEGTFEGARVRDRGSTNGTFLSGARIQQMTVYEEAVLTLGTTVLKVTVAREGHLPAPGRTSWGKVIGKSMVMQTLYNQLEKAAPTESTVLLLGDTGTGKEVIAESIHALSARHAKPFVIVDCGNMAPNLIESELFGHTKGAFSGAVNDRKGAFLEADGGTIFLDEIGELPIELQPRLLRVLESGTVKRLGEDKPRKVDVRVIAATHRDLEAEVKANRFRQDLWFRLGVVVVKIPPLRDRKEDVPLLVRAFVAQMGRGDFELPEELRKKLLDYHWPGNVRELRNVIERALAGTEVDVGGHQEGPKPTGPLPEDLTGLPYKDAKERLVDSFTEQYVTTLLDRCGGNISEVARTAGIARAYVHRLVNKYGLKATD